MFIIKFTYNGAGVSVLNSQAHESGVQSAVQTKRLVELIINEQFPPDYGRSPFALSRGSYAAVINTIRESGRDLYLRVRFPVRCRSTASAHRLPTS
ncbi:hypothetical protein AVEN_238576-1 [Araneus ventricosus]|uniref:Uncharacterized protein n=1 Tax=Araneus ventricosus TaxID=182803 RepID=A0A4Y2P8X2_ARAVE|nr:hypothetical protein AVEN_238576-1 [Araneus ventricosus]